ncbi:MAG: DUF3999 domain-containing protein [Pyrinomonadaceae bacterium]|nr:DUF3999 domain-containing protein [Pyrinomonadaceae bacterium]
MKKLLSFVFVMLAATVWLAVIVFAQAPLSSWPFFAEVTANPGAPDAPGIYDVVLPLEVMDKARDDLADLRLFDAGGREIPYALRIRREFADTREIGASVFNQGVVGQSTSEVTVDLGENPGDHNEIEVQTAGTNFRRRVEVEGSDSSKEWRMLDKSGVLFSFQSQNKGVESSRITYPTSRYRFLRVRVLRDEVTDSKAPEITGVKVKLAVHAKGELTTWGLYVPPYQLLRNQGAHASVWTIDLGARAPCDRLAIEMADASFSRPFQIENVDDPQNVRLIATGELTRHLGEEAKPLVITFDEEVHARKLRLLITDYSNPTLTILSIQASAPARQFVFELKETPTQPLRLFFGNSKITAPHYDFEKELPSKLSTKPGQAFASNEPIHRAVGSVVTNPEFKPEPLPLTERVPWLIYLVLAASSVALAIILISLARTTLQTEPQQVE